MYEEVFGFSGSPFRLAPDPKFFFGSKSHNKAMSYLHYGLRQAEGFIVITGEIGAGKSILIGHLLDQLDRSTVLAATLTTPNLTPENLLTHILSAFRIEPSGEGDAAEIEAFEDFLFDQLNHGRRVLLIVDEAQNLSLKTLEELRILSNLEYEGTPLFQVFLVGQPDFRETMARADMEQLRQRVIASYHLAPMSREETEKYIEHRLGLVGWMGEPKFASDAYDAIQVATGGLPRKIHKLCNRALLFCSVEKLNAIDGATIAMVLSDMNVEQAVDGAVDAVRADNDLDVDAAFEAAHERDDRVAEIAPAPAETTAPAKLKEDRAPEAGIVATTAPLISAPTETASAGSANAGSVFDRLRARRVQAAATPAPEENEPPKPATLDDVANAIAAARAGAAAEREDNAARRAGMGDLADAAAPEEAADTPGGWKKSVVMSINETRDELKRAHQSVVNLRKQMLDIDKRRRKRRTRIVESLDRAESLLTEFQNAWR